jgi:hypothetical protein
MDKKPESDALASEAASEEETKSASLARANNSGQSAEDRSAANALIQQVLAMYTAKADDEAAVGDAATTDGGTTEVGDSGGLEAASSRSIDGTASTDGSGPTADTEVASEAGASASASAGGGNAEATVKAGPTDTTTTSDSSAPTVVKPKKPSAPRQVP